MDMRGFAAIMFTVVVLVHIYTTYINITETVRAMEFSKNMYLKKLYRDDKRYELWDGFYLIVKENMRGEDPEKIKEKICKDLRTWTRENGFRYYFTSKGTTLPGSCENFLKVDLKNQKVFFLTQGIEIVKLVLENGEYRVMVSSV